jgi:ADP-heptose:LPS heptosyltransferase
MICGLEPTELVTMRPDIILTEEEKLWAKTKLPSQKKKVVLGFSSVDRRREYPRENRQPLIDYLHNRFPKIELVVVGDTLGDAQWSNSSGKGYNPVVYNDCIDLRNATDLRQLFAVVDRCDSAIVIDSAVLHIAGAFKKPTVFLPSTIQADWRSYPETIVVPPPVPCYPCNDRGACSGSLKGGWCTGKVKYEKIASALRKALKKQEKV